MWPFGDGTGMPEGARPLPDCRPRSLPPAGPAQPTIRAWVPAPQPLPVPDRVRLVEREDQEALGRSSRAVDHETPVPADDVTALGRFGVGLGGGLPGAGGFSRAMNPATLMAMQRLVGNRATVQAIGRRPAPGMMETLNPDEEEVALGGDAGSAGQMASPKEANAAAGPPGIGGPPGGGGPPGSGDGDPNAKGSETATKPDLLKGAFGPTTKFDETAAKPNRLNSGAGTATRGNETATRAATATTPSNTKGSETARRTEPPPFIATGTETATKPTTVPTTGAGKAATTGAGKAAATTAAKAGATAPTAGESGAGPAAAPAPGTAPAPAPAAGTPAATGPGGLPAPETASTGIDWNQMLADYGPPTRTVLEVTRLIPGWGLVGGLAADSINFASDLAAIPNSENADLATGLIVFRNFVNIGNNGLGHILYVNQLIQDMLAGSVVAAEFTPITAAINEAGTTVKVVLDEVQMGTDIVIEVEALFQSNHAPTSAEAEQWKVLADGYAANILGDVVNLVLDVISLSSLGAANTAPIQQARQPLTLAGAFMKNATPAIISAVNGVVGVWLGSLITEGRHAYQGSPAELRDQALALDAAGLIVDIEGPQARTTYDGINVVIDALSAYAEGQIAQINAVAEALSGGKSAFQLIRDAVQASLEDMNRKLGMVQQMAASATSAQANAAAISAACGSVLGALDGLAMPTVTLPSVDLGEGIVADAAEAVANRAAQAANAAIELAMSRVAAALDTAKDGVRGPVEALQEQADGLGEWLALLATECTAMIGTLSNHIASFSDGLGRCTSVEQVIDLIIGQISDLTGMPRITVQEIRDAWNSVGPYIDQFAALGPRMHQRASDLRAHADLLDAGGEMESAVDSTFLLPPGPPTEPEADAAALAAVA